MFGDAGEIIELQPGAGSGGPSARKDWTPQAQPPDPVTGIIAHTADPAAYFRGADGRTQLPRATRNHGSQGFSPVPGIVNIDPANPVTGEGGMTVDMSKITKQAADMANVQSGGNPAVAWDLAGQAAATQPAMAINSPPAVAQPGTSGYLLPHAAVGGAQIPGAMPTTNLTAGNAGQVIPDTVVTNPSIAKKASTMSVPQIVGEMPVAAIPQAAPQQPLVPDQYPPAYPANAAAVQQLPPAPVDPTQQAILQALGAISGQLQQNNARPQQQDPNVMSEARMHTDKQMQELREERENLATERARNDVERKELQKLFDQAREVRQEKPNTSPSPDPHFDAAEPIEGGDEEVFYGCDLQFLTREPQRPSIRVVFDLGRGGKHCKRFHHIAVSGMWLSMVYDTRHEGDQFIPPTTGKGEPPITITFPGDNNKQVQALVPEGCNMQIGCMDILNFIIVEPTTQSTVPTGDPLHYGEPTHEQMQMQPGSPGQISSEYAHEPSY